MDITIKLPTLKGIGRGIANVARNGYEGSVRIPSLQDAVDGVTSAAKQVGRVRVTLADNSPSDAEMDDMAKQYAQ